MVIQYDLAKEEDKSKNQGPKPKRKDQPSDNKDKPTDKPKSSHGNDKETPEGMSLFQNTTNTFPATEPNADKEKVNIIKDQMQLLQQEVEQDDDSDNVPFVHFMLNQTHRVKSRISSSWILLDIDSTCHVFNNKKFLRNIRPCAAGDSIPIT